MKKNILRLIAVMMFIFGVAFNVTFSGIDTENTLVNLEIIENGAIADEEINKDCPNGCVCGCGGCFCHEYYAYLAEAS